MKEQLQKEKEKIFFKITNWNLLSTKRKEEKNSR